MMQKLIALISGCICLVFSSLHSAVSNPLELTFVSASKEAIKLDNPHDLKLSPDGKYLYVADTGNSRVAILDPDTLELLAEFGSDHQSGTHDVDFDNQGRAYIADTHNNRITIYTIEVTGDSVTATLVGEIRERIRGPEGVLIHPNGRLYVAGAWSHNVVVYDDKKIVGELGGLSSPHDLELTPDGNIWLADAGNDRMLLLSPELDILDELRGKPFNFNGVRYQDVLPDGTLIVADKNNHAIKIISAKGELLSVLGTNDKAGKGPGKFRTPEGVEVQGTTVWLSDSGNDRIAKYSIK